jgi:3-oxoacyl-[acyl-carrier protein] reductase
MSVKECLKRAVIYIVKGVPIKKVTTSIVQIAPNELLKGRVALLTGGRVEMVLRR